MKISIIQFTPVLNDLDKNIEKINSILEGGISSDLIILPELANSGYNFQSVDEAHHSSVIADNSKFTDFLKEMSFSFNSGIVCGINERSGNKLFNSAVFINEGKLSGIYRKLHLFANEFKYFEPGNLGLPIFEFKGSKIGILICYDWAFPEVWRYLALNGASLICHPSNLVLPYAQKVIPVHSIINRIFIATANRTGTEHGITFSGNSIISDYEGTICGELSGTEEGVLTIEIDVEASKNKMLTHSNDVFRDRRIDIYCDLANLI